MEEESNLGESDEFDQVYSFHLSPCYNNVIQGVKPYEVVLQVGGVELKMEIDTGSSRSCISEEVHARLLSDFSPRHSAIKLHSYSGDMVPHLGEISVPVSCHENEKQTLQLLVVKGKRPTLLGRDWLQELRLDWKNIFCKCN